METSGEAAVFLLRPLFIGLYIGLFLCFVIFIREKFHARRLKKEIEKLKQHIQTKLEIDSESNEKRKSEIDELKKHNENLRISLQSYSDKPGRKEIKQLHLYQKAVEILTEKAPGFAQSWQSALKDVEDEMKKINLGKVPFIKRLLPGRSTVTPTLENQSGSAEK